MGRVYCVGGDAFLAILTRVGPEDCPRVSDAVKKVMQVVREAGFVPARARAGLAAFPAEAASPSNLVELSNRRVPRDELPSHDALDPVN